MATSNYYNNENGIFIVPNSESEGFTPEDFDDFQELVLDTLAEKGYTVQQGRYNMVNIYKGDLIVATLEWHSGYYEGIQVIITTDKDDLQGQFEGSNGYYGEYNDMPCKWYTPHNKRLLNTIKGLTDSYKVFAHFSSWETIYTKA